MKEVARGGAAIQKMRIDLYFQGGYVKKGMK